MSQASDSNYAAATRHLRHRRLAVQLAAVTKEDHKGGEEEGEIWSSFGAVEQLEDDDIPVERHEAVVAPLLEEGELDADAIVVSPTGNSSAAANNASERRRREEGWSDLGLEQFSASLMAARSTATSRGGRRATSSS